MPRRFRAPYSVTSQCASARRTDMAVPGSKTGTIRDTLPPSAVLGRAMIERPPLLRAAPRTKSTSPPVPDIWRVPRLSEFTWPVKSTCTAALGVDTQILAIREAFCRRRRNSTATDLQTVAVPNQRRHVSAELAFDVRTLPLPAVH